MLELLLRTLGMRKALQQLLGTERGGTVHDLIESGCMDAIDPLLKGKGEAFLNALPGDLRILVVKAAKDYSG